MKAVDDKSYKIGVVEIDQLKDEVAAIVRAMLQACSDGNGLAMAAGTVSKLSRLLPTLFHLEELLMAHLNHRGLGDHRKTHQDILAMFNGLVRYMEKEGATTLSVIQLNHFMTLVLMLHFSNKDSELRKAVDALPISPYTAKPDIGKAFLAGQG